MADFTLNAPGTVNAPWTPAGIITPVSTIKSDATGFRASTAGVYATFAHNVTYGTTIESTVTLATTGSNGDDVVVGAMVRSGVNAGAGIGVLFGLSTATIVTVTPAGAVTVISGAITITRAATNVLDVIVAISGGTATITGKLNGTPISFVGNTTTTYAAEASLAAGAQCVPQNSNTLYFSQFTGTGVASGASTLVASTGSFFFTGQAATLGNMSLQAGFGLYGLTGQSATLTTTAGSGIYTLFANAGTYSLVGAPASSAIVMPAIAGLYGLFGQTAVLTWPQAPGLTDPGNLVWKNVFIIAPSGSQKPWVDYIPVQFIVVTAAKANRYDFDGALAVKVLSSVVGKVPWVDYLPVTTVGGTATWRTDDSVGYIPMVKLI